MDKKRIEEAINILDNISNSIKESSILGKALETALVILEERKAYEDAEEQGLLLKLPCYVGTTIYMINHYWIDEGYICGIAEADDIDCFCYKVYCDPDDYTLVAISDFNESWFLTREEAEQALSEKKVKVDEVEC